MSLDAEYRRLAMKIFAEFSGSIAAPAVLAAILGTWLDDRYSTGSRYVVILLILAFLTTAIIVVKKAKKYGKLYEQLNTRDKEAGNAGDHT